MSGRNQILSRNRYPKVVEKALEAIWRDVFNERFCISPDMALEDMIRDRVGIENYMSMVRVAESHRHFEGQKVVYVSLHGKEMDIPNGVDNFRNHLVVLALYGANGKFVLSEDRRIVLIGRNV